MPIQEAGKPSKAVKEEQRKIKQILVKQGETSRKFMCDNNERKSHLIK